MPHARTLAYTHAHSHARKDNYYFGLAKDTDCLTCWIALDDADFGGT